MRGKEALLSDYLGDQARRVVEADLGSTNQSELAAATAHAGKRTNPTNHNDVLQERISQRASPTNAVIVKEQDTEQGSFFTLEPKDRLPCSR